MRVGGATTLAPRKLYRRTGWIGGAFRVLARAAQAIGGFPSDTCGNGAMSATRGKVMHGVPGLSLERTFGPSRTGAEKTGWVCEPAAAVAEREARAEQERQASLHPVKSAGCLRIP